MSHRIATVRTSTKATDLGANVEFIATFDNGVTVTARRRGAEATRREAEAKPRVYGVLDALVPEAMAEEPFQEYFIPAKPVTADDQAAAKAWSAWKRRTLKLGKAALMPYLFALADTTYIPDAQVSFSQKAGCACGCSPAFVFKGDGLGQLDYYFEAPADK